MTGRHKTLDRVVAGALSGESAHVGQENLLAARGDKTRLEMAHTIGAHNSYHAGQVVMLRQMGRLLAPSLRRSHLVG